MLEELGALCREAGDLALAMQAGASYDLKSDGSIVTGADRAVEDLLREGCAKLLPGSAFWGEESGFQGMVDGGLWAVDPIDGTSNYAFGSILWGISIALIQQGPSLVAGAIYLPALNELFLCERGQGVTRNGEQLPPPAPGAVKAHELLGCNETVLRARPDGMAGKLRCAGAFVVDAAFTLTQRYRGMLGNREMLYDVAATLMMAEELGFEVCYLDGDRVEVAGLLHDRRISQPWSILPPRQ